MNWMRAWEPDRLLARPRASMVLPVPGKSSSSRWPSETRQVRVSRMTCRLPSTAFEMLSVTRSKASRNQATSSAVAGPVGAAGASVAAEATRGSEDMSVIVGPGPHG